MTKTHLLVLLGWVCCSAWQPRQASLPRCRRYFGGPPAVDAPPPLLEWFEGHFDNHAQVQADRALGLTPGEGGGHEHIHALIRPLTLAKSSDTAVAALYYFNGNPSQLFRLRVYTIEPGDGAAGSNLVMRLWKLPAEVSGAMRRAVGSPGATADAAVAVAAELVDLSQCTELKGCEIEWCPHDGCWHAEMRHGGCLVESERTPGVAIRVTDQLVLDASTLSINDTGYDVDAGNILYGNHRGVPYLMQRTDIDDPALGWTCSGAGAPGSNEPAQSPQVAV